MPHYNLFTGRFRYFLLGFSLTGLLFLPSNPGLAQSPRPVVVFEFELVDTSGEGDHPAHDQRLGLVTAELEKLLAGTGKFRPLSTQPAAVEIAELAPLNRCNGCEKDIAKKLGGQLAFLGRVYKVSSLILSVALSVVDTESGEPVRVALVGIRGDNDKSWLRGVRYIFKHKLNWEQL